MINGLTLCTDKTAHYVWFVWKRWKAEDGHFLRKDVFCTSVLFLFSKFVGKKLHYLQNVWIIVVYAHLESSQPGVVIPHHQILQPVRSHSDQITKLFKRSTKLMFGVQTSPRHKMTKADFLWKRLWNIFYRVCVSVRGLTFSDFMIRKSDEVFTTFAVLAFVNSRQTKNPLNNKMENAIIMLSIKRIMI